MYDQRTHNKTFAYLLPHSYIEQARHWANIHEHAVFTDESIGGIGNSRSLRLAFFH